MKTKNELTDLIAEKPCQKIAFEIETGKNSLAQIAKNLLKNLKARYDRVYAIPTSEKAYKKVLEALDKYHLNYESKIKIIKPYLTIFCLIRYLFILINRF